MSKKSRKSNRHQQNANVINPYFDDTGAERQTKSRGHKEEWHPLDNAIEGRRDKKYVKNIKPRSAGQAELMKPINYSVFHYST